MTPKRMTIKGTIKIDTETVPVNTTVKYEADTFGFEITPSEPALFGNLVLRLPITIAHLRQLLPEGAGAADDTWRLTEMSALVAQAVEFIGDLPNRDLYLAGKSEVAKTLLSRLDAVRSNAPSTPSDPAQRPARRATA